MSGGAKVFISYAGNDPEWPELEVLALADLLKRLGAEVWLDRWYEVSRADKGTAPAEWRVWMRKGLEGADRVVCLASERYTRASERDIGEAWGYGVAYESQKLFAGLYGNKGHNDGRILTLRPDGASMRHVPPDLAYACPGYEWPKQREAALRQACMLLAVDVGDGGAGEGTPDKDEAEAQLARHLQITVDRLLHPDAAAFQKALHADLQSRGQLPDWAKTPVRPFIQGVAAADPQQARQVMLAVRRALKTLGKPLPGPVCDAAVALSMLCASRWLNRVPTVVPGRALPVPADLRHHALAVLSAAMFGGVVMVVPDAQGQPAPQHLYELRTQTPISSHSLLVALYDALVFERQDVPDMTGRDTLSGSQVKTLLGYLKGRLDAIREVEESSFTLTLSANCVEAWARADWKDGLQISPFVLDEGLSQDLFAMSPDELEAAVYELWLLIRPA